MSEIDRGVILKRGKLHGLYFLQGIKNRIVSTGMTFGIFNIFSLSSIEIMKE